MAVFEVSGGAQWVYRRRSNMGNTSRGVLANCRQKWCIGGEKPDQFKFKWRLGNTSLNALTFTLHSPNGRLADLIAVWREWCTRVAAGSRVSKLLLLVNGKLCLCKPHIKLGKKTRKINLLSLSNHLHGSGGNISVGWMSRSTQQ